VVSAVEMITIDDDETYVSEHYNSLNRRDGLSILATLCKQKFGGPRP